MYAAPDQKQRKKLIIAESTSASTGLVMLAGKQVKIRPVLEEGSARTHAWSTGTNDSHRALKLDSLEEGGTRLVACKAFSKSVQQGTSAHAPLQQPSKEPDRVHRRPSSTYATSIQAGAFCIELKSDIE